MKHGSPLRTCVGCRHVEDQHQLMRWVVDAEEPTRVIPDHDRRRPGRGAWLHPNTECAQLAVRRRGFSRAFKTGNLNHDLDALLAALSDRPTQGGPDTIPTPESGSEAVETR